MVFLDDLFINIIFRYYKVVIIIGLAGINKLTDKTFKRLSIVLINHYAITFSEIMNSKKLTC